MRLTHFIVLLGLITVLASCTPASSPTEERIARIEANLERVVKMVGAELEPATLAERMMIHNVPGVSVAVINNGEIEWARGWGWADVERDWRVTDATLFQSASISKPVAVAGALSLVEEGLLDLDQNVNDKLTTWQIPDNEFTTTNKVTLRGLMGHTAGTTVWGFPGYARDEDVPSTLGVLLGEGNTDPIVVYKEPGEGMRYSGGGYTLFQLMMTDVTGQSFPAILDEHVLIPAGMEASTYEQPLPEDLHDLAASGYRNDGEKVEGDWHIYPEMAAAGLWATPSDLARFAIAIQQSIAGVPDALLQQATAEEMLKRDPDNYALGLGVSEDGALFGHSGANEGFRCRMLAFRDSGQGIVVMTNSDNGSFLAEEIIYTVAREYGWDHDDMKPTERLLAEVDAAAYEAVAGTYTIEGAGELEVAFDGESLVATGPMLGRPLELYPESDTLFFTLNDPRTLRFYREEGSIAGFRYGGGIQGIKVE